MIKDVLKLAETKGYKPILCHLAKYGGSAKLPNSVTDEAAALCELSLIQKWLRETYIMFIQIELTTPYDLKASVVGEGMELHCSTIRFSRDQYNEATLYCTEKALQLI